MREPHAHGDVSTPDHVRDGRTLPGQIEGDHAYRDDPPEYDPGLWASASLTCLICGTEYPDAPGAERADRLRNGQIDVGHCPDCDRYTPAVERSKVDDMRLWLVVDETADITHRQTHTCILSAHLTFEAAEARREQMGAFRTEAVDLRDWPDDIGDL